MRIRFQWLAAPAFALLCVPALADHHEAARPSAATATVADVQACMRGNLIGRAALRDLAVKVTDREGLEHALKLKLYWKPDSSGRVRLNLRLVEPTATRGSSYLLLQTGGGEEVYFWLPVGDRALRITGQNTAEPLWGTDFSYAEIKQVLGLIAIGDSERKADAKIDKRAAWVLETRTSLADTGYSMVRSYVDQATCTLLKSEFFAKGDQPRKVLDADVSTLLQADRYWTVLGYMMRDLRAGSRTRLDLSDFTVDERLPERLFDPKRFFEPFE